MITPNQIARLVEMEAYPRLVDRILANGRCDTPAAVRRLQRPDAAAPAGIGLALQRVCELTYRPDRQGRRLVEKLLRLQCQDGLFRSGSNDSMRWQGAASLGASAVALRALLAWRGQHVESEGKLDSKALAAMGSDTVTSSSAQSTIDEAIHAGIAALVAALPRCGDAIDADIVLWQLGRAEVLRREMGQRALSMLAHDLDARRDANDDLADLARAAAA